MIGWTKKKLVFLLQIGDDISQGLVERIDGHPAGMGEKPGSVDALEDVFGAIEGGIDDRLDLGADDCLKPIEQIADPHMVVGCDIVGETASSTFEEEAICANDIADIGEIADGVEIPDLHFRNQTFFRIEDLLSESGCHEFRRLSGTDMVSGACDDDLQAIGCGITLEESFARDLGDGVVGNRQERGILANREFSGGFGCGSVDLGGRDEQEPGLWTFEADGICQIEGSSDIDAVEHMRILHSVRDGGDGGEMNDCIGLNVADQRAHILPIPQICGMVGGKSGGGGGVARNGVHCDDFIAVTIEFVDKVMADKTGGARNQNPMEARRSIHTKILSKRFGRRKVRRTIHPYPGFFRVVCKSKHTKSDAFTFANYGIRMH